MHIERDDELSKAKENMLQRDALELYRKRLEEDREYAEKAITPRKIAEKAAGENKWIYHTPQKAWYTPEEFMIRFGRTFANHPTLKEMQVLDPIQGLEAGFIKVSELQDKIFSFAKRIINYYRNRHGNI